MLAEAYLPRYGYRPDATVINSKVSNLEDKEDIFGSKTVYSLPRLERRNTPQTEIERKEQQRYRSVYAAFKRRPSCATDATARPALEAKIR